MNYNNPRVRVAFNILEHRVFGIPDLHDSVGKPIPTYLPERVVWVTGHESSEGDVL